MDSAFGASVRKPAFVTIMKLEKNATKQLLPKDLVKYLLEDLHSSGIATLTGWPGRSWKVKVHHYRGDIIFLLDGWQQFVKDHSLVDGDRLLITYEGNLCFEVRIFSKNGMEKFGGEASSSQNRQTVLADGKGLEGRAEKGKQLKDPADGEGLQGQPKKARFDYRVRYKTVGIGAKYWAKEIQSFSSSHPYIKVSLLKRATSTPYQLDLRTDFSRRHLPQSNCKLSFKNIRGEAWDVNLVYTKGTHTFCKGWGCFVRANHLKIEDICIFELVAENEMLVHIFRQS